MYKEYSPNILLAPYVEAYWTSDLSIQEQQRMRILPDGCVDLLFNLVESENNGIKPFVPYIIGTMTTYSDVVYEKKISMIGIRFRPCAIAAYTKIPINEFTNSQVDARLIKSLFDDFICDKLIELTSETAQIAYIDSYLSQKLDRLYSVDRQIIRVANYIRGTNGVIPINELLNDVCWSQRQFERQFKNLTGVTPKMFSAITRFRNAKRYLKLNPDKSLFSIALDCGYYDHAHLFRDFKRFGDMSPQR